MTVSTFYSYLTDLLTAPIPTDTVSAGASWRFNSDFYIATSLGYWRSQYSLYGGISNEVQVYNEMEVRNSSWTWAEQEEYVNNDYTPNKQVLTVDFIWGDYITIALGVSLNCSSGIIAPVNGSFSSCLIDASQSSYWDGISNVTSNGKAVNEFSLFSGTGVDFSKSLVPPNVPVDPPDGEVPEPSTMILIIIGAVSLRNRKRRQSK